MNTTSARAASGAFVAALLLAGCNASNDAPSGEAAASANDGVTPPGSAGDAGSDAQGSYPGADIGMAPVALGVTRFVTSPMTVGPGQDVFWEEWVAPPLTEDTDVVAVTGKQSVGGHHANLYADSNVQPVGTNHAFQQADQLTQRMLGGVGGEAGASITLPTGVVWRAPKGDALVMQEHYINASASAIVARSGLDMKATPANPANKTASILSNVTLKIDVPAGQMATAEATCVVNHDYPAFMWANHMHGYGTSIVTDLVAPDGTTQTLQSDPAWDPNWAFNPIYKTFSVDAPFVIPQGSTLHTKCTWMNTTGSALTFPDEMCIFAAFFVGDKDASCTDGTW